MAVKDFTQDAIKAQVERRQADRKKAKVEGAEVLMSVVRDSEGKLSIDVEAEDIHPIHLMLGIMSQHIELLEKTMQQMLSEINRLQSRVQELEGTNIVVPDVIPPKDLVQ